MARFRTDNVTWNTTAGNKTVTITPNAGDVLVVFAANSGTTNVPVITDDRGGTYYRPAGGNKNASADRMDFYIRDKPCQLAVLHTLTMDISGAGTGGGLWVAAIADLGKSGENARRTAGTQNNGTAATVPTVTLAIAPIEIRPEDLVIFCVFNTTNGAGITEPSGFTERRDVGFTSPASGMEVATRDSGQTGTSIAAQNASASAYGAIVVVLDATTVTAVQSGRDRNPGAPHELLRRRPARPTQDFTNTSVSGPVTEIAVIGGAIAGGVTPVAVVANTSQGATGQGVSPAPRTTLTSQGATGQGVTPTSSTTLTSQGATGQGTTPAPQVPLSSQGATGQGVNPTANATAVFTIQGATAQGQAPGAGVPPAQGGVNGTGTGPVAVVTLTSQGATASGNPPGVTEVATPGGATAGGNSPTAVASVSPGGATTEVSGYSTLASDDFNRANSLGLGTDWSNNSGQFDVISNQAWPNNAGGDAGHIWNTPAFADDQWAQVSIADIDNGSGPGTDTGGGLQLRADGTGDNFYRIVANNCASGNVGVAKFVGGVYSNIAIFSASPIPSVGDVLFAQVVGTKISVYINGVLVGEVNDSDITSGQAGIASSGPHDTKLDDWSAGDVLVGAVVKAIVTVTPGGATSGGNAPSTDAGTTETPTFGGATASGNSPTPTVTGTAQGANANGSSPVSSTSPTPGGAQANGTAASPSTSVTISGSVAGGNASTPAASVDAGGSSTGSGSITAVVSLTSQGATSGGNAPGTLNFETPTPSGAIASGNSPSAVVTTSPGGANANGTTPSPTVPLTSQGATATGNGPSDSSSETVTPGGSTAQGTGPLPTVFVDPGGAVTGTPSAGAELAADDFNRANGTLGSDWQDVNVNGFNNYFQIDSNRVVPDNSGDDQAAYNTTVAFPDDQYAEAVVTGLANDGGANSGFGVGLRMSGAAASGVASLTGYRIMVSNNLDAVITVDEFSGGSYLGQLASWNTGPWVDGDILKATIVGSLISVYKNGSLVGTVIDSSISSGSAGIIYSSSCSGFIDEWAAGSVVVGIKAIVSVTPGGATAHGNAPSAPMSEQPTFGGAIAGGNAATPAASVDAAGNSTGGGTTTTATLLTPGGAIANGRSPTEIGVTPPAPVGPTPGSGGAKRVQALHNRIEDDRRIREEDEEEALLLLGLSLE